MKISICCIIHQAKQSLSMKSMCVLPFNHLGDHVKCYMALHGIPASRARVDMTGSTSTLIRATEPAFIHRLSCRGHSNNNGRSWYSAYKAYRDKIKSSQIRRACQAMWFCRFNPQLIRLQGNADAMMSDANRPPEHPGTASEKQRRKASPRYVLMDVIGQMNATAVAKMKEEVRWKTHGMGQYWHPDYLLPYVYCAKFHVNGIRMVD